MSGLATFTNLSFIRNWGERVGEEVTVSVSKEVSVLVNVADFDGRMLALFGTHDPKIVAVCKALLRKDDHFVDIGSNYGAIALKCADVVGPDGAIHMFEPQPDLCCRILRATEGMVLPWMHLYQMGLMDKDDQVPLRRFSHHSGKASLVRGDDGDCLTVPVKDIRTAVPPIVAGRPFGVKIDVEGAETTILPHLLRMPGLRFVVCECISNHDQIWEALKLSGFAVFGIPKTLFRSRVCRVREVKELSFYHDLLAVRVKDPSILHRRLHPGRLATHIVN